MGKPLYLDAPWMREGAFIRDMHDWPWASEEKMCVSCARFGSSAVENQLTHTRFKASQVNHVKVCSARWADRQTANGSTSWD